MSSCDPPCTYCAKCGLYAPEATATMGNLCIPCIKDESKTLTP